jgi:hypothetical protein
MNPADLARAGTEHAHQVALFAWAALEARDHPELKLMFAIPNGGKRDARTGAMMQAEGVRPGVPDIFLPVSRHGLHGLFIELKKPGGTVSSKQTDMLQALIAQGYAIAVAIGWDQARQFIIKYLTDKWCR